jgi:hypothetical protein
MPVLPDASASPFRRPDAAPLDPAKFRDSGVTAKGERRAVVPLSGLTTLWFNTGTLCNLACATCYIHSSPTNDALLYISAGEVAGYLDEIARERLPVREIGLTGGEPFMNRRSSRSWRRASGAASTPWSSPTRCGRCVGSRLPCCACLASMAHG